MREQILQDLTGIFSSVLGRKLELREEYSAADIKGWDSLTHVQLMIATEQKFGFRLAPFEIANMRTLGDLVTLIEAKS